MINLTENDFVCKLLDTNLVCYVSCNRQLTFIFPIQIQMIGTSTRLPPNQRLVEIKSVAEQLHFKVSTLLLHGGKIVEAITWFHKHISNYQRLVGTTEVAFLHWEWFSRQFLVFAELLDSSSATLPSNASFPFGPPGNRLTEWEFQPAYYYQVHLLDHRRVYFVHGLKY